MVHRVTLMLVLGASLPLAALAQNINPEAKSQFQKAVAAANAKDFAGALQGFKTAAKTDGSVFAMDDQGALDAIIGFYKGDTAGKPSAAGWASLGDAYKMKGMFKEGLDAYRKAQGLDASNDGLKTAIKEMEALTAASGGGSGGSSGSSGSSGATGGSEGSPSGGGSTGTGSGEASSGGSGGAGGSGGTGGPSTGASPGAGGDQGNEQVKQLQQQIADKDQQIADKDKQIEDLKAENAKLKDENTKLNLYKVGVLNPVTNP